MKLETWTMLGADENHLTPDPVRNPHLQQTLIAGLGHLWPHNVKGGEAGKRGRTWKLRLKRAVTLVWPPLSSEILILHTVVTSKSSPCTGDVQLLAGA